MKNRIIIQTFLLVVIFIACNQQKKEMKKYDFVDYYDTGELLYTAEILNDNEAFGRFYFKNGQVSEEGVVYNNLRNGNWKTYYTDGVLRGKLIFSKDTFVGEIVHYPVKLDFKDNPTEFKAGNSYQFRILGASALSIDFPIKIFGELEKFSTEVNPYVYGFTPRKAGTDTIMITINIANKDVKNDSIFFPITIVE